MTLSYFKRRFNKYANKAKQEYGIGRVRLFFGFLSSNIVHGASIKDYFTFKFFLLSHKGKKQFVTNRKQQRYYKKHNDAAAQKICDDKERALIDFAEFIGRDWVGCKFRNTREECDAFVSKHKRAVIKPLSLSGGHGVRVVDTERLPDGRSLCELLTDGYIAEEVICQHSDMARMNPTSLNTLRVMVKDGALVGVIFRFGRCGSSVDNASSGGIYAEVDMEGICVSLGLDYDGNTYIKHPDTDTVIPGFKIPMWQQVVSFAREAVKVLPGIKIYGLDIAITESGPLLVEVNARPDCAILQTPRLHGAAHIYK